MNEVFHQDSIIYDVLAKYPDAERIFKEFGIRCFG
ncbi:hypothetical protein HNQ80_002808 [Anaerosolibacter carboniphilus]|uniref:DUF1858 domain-containing protein n=1 Tax=Anaerosolibacter carboniphilus TaxID=1417629 RepID=A0A841KSJ3_9FIRM|nr:DUF1858 domain-containing protein [Anaerosolibacter carboniphilus]MBB6216704.1 hypothetical protein [Anaerosolibacter carboniphilus]